MAEIVLLVSLFEMSWPLVCTNETPTGRLCESELLRM